VCSNFISTFKDLIVHIWKKLLKLRQYEKSMGEYNG